MVCDVARSPSNSHCTQHRCFHGTEAQLTIASSISQRQLTGRWDRQTFFSLLKPGEVRGKRLSLGLPIAFKLESGVGCLLQPLTMADTDSCGLPQTSERGGQGCLTGLAYRFPRQAVCWQLATSPLPPQFFTFLFSSSQEPSAELVARQRCRCTTPSLARAVFCH